MPMRPSRGLVADALERRQQAHVLRQRRIRRGRSAPGHGVRRAIPPRAPAAAGLAFTTDTSLLTAAANDLGFERVFARQVEALGRARATCCSCTRRPASRPTCSPRPQRRGSAASSRSACSRAAAARCAGTSTTPSSCPPTTALMRRSCTWRSATCHLRHHRDARMGRVGRRDDEPAHGRHCCTRPARAEKLQALFYRGACRRRRGRRRRELSERLNGLHADEQHHLSRLTVRLVELERAGCRTSAECCARGRAARRLGGWRRAARAGRDRALHDCCWSRSSTRRTRA
jgi:hypothetical protein